MPARIRFPLLFGQERTSVAIRFSKNDCRVTRSVNLVNTFGEKNILILLAKDSAHKTSLLDCGFGGVILELCVCLPRNTEFVSHFLLCKTRIASNLTNCHLIQYRCTSLYMLLPFVVNHVNQINVLCQGKT